MGARPLVSGAEVRKRVGDGKTVFLDVRPEEQWAKGRSPGARTRFWTADVADGVLRFRRLGPEAPQHVGVSGGPGLIWFVAESMSEPGLQRYCEPDLIRLDGNLRWRTTVLWRDARLVRPMLVQGTRFTSDTARTHEWDPRGADAAVHGARSQTMHYTEQR